MIHYVEAIDLVNKVQSEFISRQSCDKIGDELKPFLISEDGIVEGFYNIEKNSGVQFHRKTKGYQRI